MAYIDICMHPYFLHYFVLRFKAKYPNFAKQDSKFTVMKHIYLYLIIIVTCILSSCNLGGGKKGVLPKELVQAENIMYENPDSALHILQAMQIPTEKEAHATWALLLTQAKYKCFVVQSDSLVNIAHDYFMKGDNVQRKAMTLYHKGVLHEEKNQADEALPYYLKAAEEVSLTEDYCLSYLIYSHIGMIYAYRKLHDFAKFYCKKANKYAFKTNNSYYIIDSYNCLARTYSIQGNYNQAFDYYNKSIELGISKKEKKVLQSALFEKAFLYLNIGENEKAHSVINQFEFTNISSQDYLTMGYLYSRLNITDSAYYFLDKATSSDNIYTTLIPQHFSLTIFISS